MSKRRRCCVGLLCGVGLLLAGGCASPSTGRVRDAHLMQQDWRAPTKLTTVEKAGPFYEKVETADGAIRESWRPFLSTRIQAADGVASRREILWPIYGENRRGDSVSWRFLTCFGYDADVTDSQSTSRLWAFPVWFMGRTQRGEAYTAFFPFYGTIREMYADRIDFAFFPIWARVKRLGNQTDAILWPIYTRTTGPTAEGFKFFPFYGEMDRKGRAQERFIMWPIWTSAVYTNRNPGTAWMCFPVVGHVDRESEKTWMILPPLFNFTHGKGQLSTYRKINAPWPLVRIRDEETRHVRAVFPIWGHRWDDDGSSEGYWALWPFYTANQSKRKDALQKQWALRPIVFQSSIRRDLDKDGEYEQNVEDYLRVWPLFTHRTDDENRYFRFPDLTFSKRTGTLERNLLDIFTLYTRGEEVSEAHVEHELLWGAIKWGHRRGRWSWSLLGGFLGRYQEDDQTYWRILWFRGKEAQ